MPSLPLVFSVGCMQQVTDLESAISASQLQVERLGPVLEELRRDRDQAAEALQVRRRKRSQSAVCVCVCVIKRSATAAAVTVVLYYCHFNSSR